MKVLHAFNQPRSGGGSLASTLATIDISRKNGIEVDVFTRDSSDLPSGLRGKVQASISAFYAPGSLKAFARQLDKFKPDIVHANELFPLLSPEIFRLCKKSGIPVVVTCDDYHLTCPVRTHYRQGEICTDCMKKSEFQAVAKNCRGDIPESVINAMYNAWVRKRGYFQECVDQFITCSEFSREWLVEHVGLDRESVTAIPHAIQIPPERADPRRGEYVSFGGRFVPEKGIDVLLAAGERSALPISLSRNEKHFVTIDLPQNANVVVTKGREDLAEFYRGARFLVMPSTWFETYGVVGAESMSHGIPVIASRLGALENLIEDGVDGLLFEPGNVDDLAEKMESLWGDPERLVTMGEAARQKAIDKWSPEVNFRQTLEVYRRLA